MTVFPAFRISGRFVVGAEPAVIDTFVCWFNMKIPVEICDMPLFLLLYNT